MLNVQVETNAPEVADWFRRLYSDQIPFATSRAINATAISFQEKQRQGIRERFTIRRQWVLRGVKINREDFARKDRLEARVHIDSARDFLIKFEKGGRKRPEGSRLAIPAEVRRTKAGVVSRTLRPRALDFKPTGDGRYAGQKKTFMLRRPGGRGVIFQFFGRRGNRQTRTLFTFAPSAKIEPILKFEETATATIKREFEGHFSREFDRAVRTAR